MFHKSVGLASTSTLLYCEVPSAVYTSLVDAISIEIIFRPQRVVGSYNICYMLNYSYANNSGIYVYYDWGNNRIYYSIGFSSSIMYQSAVTPYRINGYNHIIATYDRVNYRLHVNGGLDNISGSASDPIYYRVDTGYVFGRTAFVGVCGELFIIHNRCLSSDECIHRFRHPWSYQHHIDAGDCAMVIDPSKSNNYLLNLATGDSAGTYYGSIYNNNLTLGKGEFC